MSFYQFIRHIGFYVPSQYASQLIGIANAFMMRYFLGPFAMGVWSAIQMILSYASYTRLGIMSAVFYQVPILKGQGNTEEIDRFQSAVFSFVAACAFAVSCGLIAAAFILRAHISQQMFYGLIVAGVLLVAQRMLAFHVGLLRAHKRFEVLSLYVILEAITNFCLIFMVVSRWKLRGLCMISLFLPLAGLLFLRSRHHFSFRLVWDKKRIWAGIRYGFPIFIRDWLLVILNSVDRLMVIVFLGFESMGLFSLAYMTRSGSFGLFRGFEHVISPYILEHYGAAQDARKTAGFMIQTTLVQSLAMSFVLGSICLFAAPMIGTFLPKFTAGVPAMRIYLASIFFACITSQCTTFVTAMGKQVRLVPAIGAAIAANVFFNWAAIRAGFGIAGVSAVTTVVSGCVFLFTFIYAIYLVKGRAFYQVLKVIVYPVAACALILFLETRFASVVSWRASGLRWCFFVAGLSPLLILLNGQTKILDRLREAIRSRRGGK